MNRHGITATASAHILVTRDIGVVTHFDVALVVQQVETRGPKMSMVIDPFR